MKKLKIKFDKKTLLDFLLQNVEKIVFGVIAIMFLWMLVSSLSSAGRFDKTPDKLSEGVAKAHRDIDSTPADPKLDMTDYASLAQRSRDRVNEKPYVTSVAWDPPLFEKRPLRGAPPLFAVRDLRGFADMGPFHMASVARNDPPDAPDRGPPGRPGRSARSSAAPAGGEGVRGKRWIVITGLVPIGQQERAYADTFRQSQNYDATNDSPRYLGYWVERVEVTTAAEAAHPDWSKAKQFLSTKAIGEALREFGTLRDADIVGQEYVDKALTFPLGPLGRPWDVSTAHEPEIPIEKISVREPSPSNSGKRRQTSGMPGMSSRMGNTSSGEASTENTPFDDTASAGDSRKESAEAETRTEEKKAPTSKLFRFFDFSVEPNKQYVYRVCLALRNPNEGMKPMVLKKPELANDKFLKTNWSDPSPPVAVPRDTRIYLVSVKPPRPGGEPSAEIMMTKWVERTGAEVFIKVPADSKDSPIVRGEVLNFSDRAVKTIGIRASRQADVGGAPSRLDAGPAVFLPAGDSGKQDINSGATAVDIRVGERHSGGKKSNAAAAGEILILDGDGSLAVHDELNELATCEQITAAAVEPRRESRAPSGTDHRGPTAGPTMGPPAGPPRGGPRGGPLDTLEKSKKSSRSR